MGGRGDGVLMDLFISITLRLGPQEQIEAHVSVYPSVHSFTRASALAGGVLPAVNFSL